MKKIKIHLKENWFAYVMVLAIGVIGVISWHFLSANDRTDDEDAYAIAAVEIEVAKAEALKVKQNAEVAAAEASKRAQEISDTVAEAVKAKQDAESAKDKAIADAEMLRKQSAEALKAKQDAEAAEKTAKAKLEADAKANQTAIAALNKELEELKAAPPKATPVAEGEMSVVFRPFDPARDIIQTKAGGSVHHDKLKDEPVFSVQSTPDRGIKVRMDDGSVGLVDAQPVITPTGKPLKDSGFTPRLKDSNYRPYRLDVETTVIDPQTKREEFVYVKHWFAEKVVR